MNEVLHFMIMMNLFLNCTCVNILNHRKLCFHFRTHFLSAGYRQIKLKNVLLISENVWCQQRNANHDKSWIKYFFR